MARQDAPRTPSLRKRMILMLIAAAVIFGGVFGVKAVISAGTNQFFDSMPQPAIRSEQRGREGRTLER